MSTLAENRAQPKFHWAWAIFFGLCIYNFCSYGLVLSPTGQFLRPICEDLGFTNAQFSLMTTIRGVTGGLITSMAGRILPKVNCKIYFTIVSIAFGGLSILQSTFTQLWQFYVAGFFFGVLAGIGIYATLQLIIPQWFAKPERFLGIAVSTTGIGAAIFSPILGGIMESSGWRSAYLFQGVLSMIAMGGVSLFILRYNPAEMGLRPYGVEKLEAKQAEQADVANELVGYTQKEIARKPVFILLILVSLFSGTLSALFAHIPAAISEKGFGLLLAGGVSGIYQLGTGIGQFGIGFVNSKLGTRNTTVIYLGMVFLACIGMVVVNAPIFLAFAVIVFFIGAGRAVSSVQISNIVRSVVGMKEYGKIFSPIYMLAIVCASVVITPIGMLYDATQSYDTFWLILAGVMAVLIAMVIATMSIAKKMHQKDNISL